MSPQLDSDFSALGLNESMMHAQKQQVATYVAALINWNLGPHLEPESTP
jgi:hypothetical protein